MTALAPRLLQRLSLPGRRLAARRAMHRLGYERVFGIGAARTGTSSLGRAFVLLGFRHTSWDPELWDAYERGNFEPIFAVAERYETFEDGPWNAPDFYRTLDARFPNSKFVLTYREPESWSRSHEHHFSSQGSRNIPERYWIEDYPGRRQQIRLDYETRSADVRKYFAARPDDLLVLDVVGGDGWERLCPFLGLEPPRRQFPHLNAG